MKKVSPTGYLLAFYNNSNINVISNLLIDSIAGSRLADTNTNLLLHFSIFMVFGNIYMPPNKHNTRLRVDES